MTRPWVVITAGGTAEPLDDVRVLSNRSTGRLGVALASAALRQGARVRLIAATSVDLHLLSPDVEVRTFTTTRDLDAALSEATALRPELVLMAAAVADYLPATTSGKLRSDAASLELSLQRGEKLLPDLPRRFGVGCRVVGFKLLSQVDDAELLRVAAAQRAAHDLHATVANDMARLGEHAHPCWLVTADGAAPLDGPRERVAEALIDALLPPPSLPDLTPPGWPRLGRVTRWWPVARGGRPAEGGAEAARAALRDSDGQRPVTAQDDAGATWRGGSARDEAEHHAAVPDGAVPLLDRGRLVGTTTTGATPEITPLGPAGAWAHDLLPALGAVPLRLGGDAAAWRRLGFTSDDGRAWVGPWAREGLPRGASALLWHPASRCALLGRRPDGLLAPPGGRVEPGEAPEAAALRELREETGLCAEALCAELVDTRRAWFGADPTWQLTTLVLRVPTREPPSPTAELQARWWPLGEALRDPLLAPGAAAILRALWDR